MKCDCVEWKENVPKIDGVFALQYVRMGKGYEGIPFKFCPWCSKPLKENNEKENP